MQSWMQQQSLKNTKNKTRTKDVNNCKYFFPLNARKHEQIFRTHQVAQDETFYEVPTKLKSTIVKIQKCSMKFSSSYNFAIFKGT
jgi:hypothetical protein